MPIGTLTPPIINNRLFYTIIIFFIIIQAIIIQLQIESKIIMGFFGLIFVLLFFFSLNKPELAIMGLTIYIPFSKIIVGHITTGVNFTNAFLIIIIFAWFISHEYREERFIVFTPLNFPILLFTLLGLVSVIQGSSILADFEGVNVITSFWRWFTPMFLFIITVNNIRDKDSIKKVIVLVMITTTIVALMTIKEYIDLGEFSSWEKARIGGISNQPNALGAYFVNYAPIILGIFATSGLSFKHMFLIIPILLCARAVHVTFSRGAWLAYVVAHLFVGIFSKSKKIIIFGLLIIAFFAINPSMLPESIKARFQMTFKKEKTVIERPMEAQLEKSVSDRLIIWKGAIRMIKANPILGMGYNSFPYFIMSYSEIEERRDPHNTFLKIGTEMGLPALLMFLVLIAIVFINTIWVYRHVKSRFFKGATLGFMGSSVGLIISCMFGSRLNSLEIAGQYWILAGVFFRLKILLKNEMAKRNYEKTI